MKSLQSETFQQNKLDFEQWMERKLRASRSKGLQRQQAIYQVPVVVHVIHNGEAIGSGTNISDAQILSQIAVLNKDYQRLNVDASDTPPEFQPVAGNMDVEFVLAKQDPEGLASSGIVRVQGSKSVWSINDNYELKALSYWPAEDYMNIWVCNITGLLGYAQFPVSGLPGLENSSNNRLTDGIVIAYNAFGSEDDGPFNLINKYKKGRTTTHEVGHFFGLRHVWGDDDGQCDGSDYVTDTPNQGDRSSGCPSYPQMSCGVSTMFQNFLDYTDDACMNLFTSGQVGRMITVLENSPRRASLLSSPGLDDPLPASNDLGIRDIISPLAGECTNEITPVIEVKNYGINTVSAATIAVQIDGSVVETKTFTINPPLSPMASATLNFTPAPLPSGLHNIDFEIVETNGGSDGGPSNNDMGRSVLIPEFISLPVTEAFNSIPPSWQIINPDLKTTWTLATAPNANPSNTAMKMDFYNYEDNLGEIDVLITPVFSLTDDPVALLLFDVAYARFQDDNDGLKVVVLSDCNADVTAGTVVYDKSGADLQTRPPTSSDFVPINDSQWRNELVDLSAFAGQSNLQLAFVGINDWGNNLYLDNISILSTPLNDIELVDIIAPSAVVCTNEVSPKIRIRNGGTLVASLKIRVTLNGQNSVVQEFSGLNFLGGTQIELDLSPITLASGDNTIFFELLEPNGLPDINPSNNVITLYNVVNSASDVIPIRENFEDVFEDRWTIINPKGGMDWQVKNFGTNKALFFDGYNNTLIGDQSWVVSPVLDFSDAPDASMSFDLSYAVRGNAVDRLHVLVSRDCGITFSDTVFEASRSRLARGQTSMESWEPQDTEWQRAVAIGLTDFIGEDDVRVAFVFTNGNGNNIYLDNIEFFVSGAPIVTDKPISVYPNPFVLSEQNIQYLLRVTFSLPVKGQVTIELIDMAGRVLISEAPQNVLNQTYTISIPDMPTGTYVMRAISSAGIFTERVIIFK
jgi:hypothetical protein